MANGHSNCRTADVDDERSWVEWRRRAVYDDAHCARPGPDAAVYYQSAASLIAAVVAVIVVGFVVLLAVMPTQFLYAGHIVAAGRLPLIIFLLLVGTTAFAVLRQNPNSAFRSEGRYTFATLAMSSVDAIQDDHHIRHCAFWRTTALRCDRNVFDPNSGVFFFLS